jgi:hypothetical protein
MQLKALSRVAVAILLCLCGSLAGPQPGRAQGVEQFYKGRTIAVLTTAPGGRYDLTSRLVARHLGQFVPGPRLRRRCAQIECRAQPDRRRGHRPVDREIGRHAEGRDPTLQRHHRRGALSATTVLHDAGTIG